MPLETPMETIVTAAELAHKAGAWVVLNPAPAQHLSPERLKNVDVLIPNEHEAAFMSGIEIHSASRCPPGRGALTAVRARQCDRHHGQPGRSDCRTAEPDIIYTHTRAFPSRPSIPLPLGMPLSAALAVALGEGRSLADAARFASAAAAISVTRLAPSPPCPPAPKSINS